MMSVWRLEWYPVHLSLGKLRKGHNDATESCFKSIRLIRCRRFGSVVRSHVGSNRESSCVPVGLLVALLIPVTAMAQSDFNGTWKIWSGRPAPQAFIHDFALIGSIIAVS
jgi:hypothetical protein